MDGISLITAPKYVPLMVTNTNRDFVLSAAVILLKKAETEDSCLVIAIDKDWTWGGVSWPSWNTDKPTGSLPLTSSWTFLYDTDLPLLVSYKYKWPLFYQMMKGDYLYLCAIRDLKRYYQTTEKPDAQ
jgi:hypothetical protein